MALRSVEPGPELLAEASLFRAGGDEPRDRLCGFGGTSPPRRELLLLRRQPLDEVEASLDQPCFRGLREPPDLLEVEQRRDPTLVKFIQPGLLPARGARTPFPRPFEQHQHAIQLNGLDAATSGSKTASFAAAESAVSRSTSFREDSVTGNCSNARRSAPCTPGAAAPSASGTPVRGQAMPRPARQKASWLLKSPESGA